jgi:hypothetical protein
MTSTPSRPTPFQLLWLLKPAFWLVSIAGFLCRALLTAWASLTVYYSNLPWLPLRALLALTVFALSIHLLWRSRTKHRFLIFSAVFFVILVWWASIHPSHDRPWRPDVAVMPRASINGDLIHLTGFRHFDYRSTNDFTIRYEDGTYSLSDLQSMDFFVSYWKLGPVGHTFVSFNFDNAPPLCISIETRPEVGEGFAPIASLFKQFELIYVIGDERDIVKVRTNHRHESVFLYRISSTPEKIRRLLLTYLEKINELADQPEFYHLLSNNCTVNIAAHAKAIGRTDRFDIRYLLNGLIDQYLYGVGAIDTTLPFPDLRERSSINAAALAAADAPLFSERIRANLPTTLR